MWVIIEWLYKREESLTFITDYYHDNKWNQVMLVERTKPVYIHIKLSCCKRYMCGCIHSIFFFFLQNIHTYIHTQERQSHSKPQKYTTELFFLSEAKTSLNDPCTRCIQ